MHPERLWNWQGDMIIIDSSRQTMIEGGGD
jgi:hypothetical protein